MALVGKNQSIPRITVISYKGLSRLVHSLTPVYRNRAHIRIIDTVFDEAVEIARDIDRRGEVDVFLSAGANGAFLRDAVSLPTVQIKVTGFDLARAIVKARKISDRIALVTYKEKAGELAEVKQLLDMEIEERLYTTVDDVKEQFHDLASRGYRVIIGSSMVVELAEREGLTGILVYSANSVHQAIDDAIEVSHILHAEASRTERLNTILCHINEGVVSVGQDEYIQSLNPTMEGLLGISASSAINKRLSELAPELSLQRTLESGKSELQTIQLFGHKTIVTNRIPIKHNGLLSGAVLTFQDATAIEKADRNIRAQNRTRKFVAKYQLSNIIGTSQAIQDAKMLATQYAKTDSTILITGESGTGKELFAQGIHNASRRRNRPFVAINCAAIPESLLESELFGYVEGSFTGSRRGGKTGLFEMAHTGTIFLDEIGDMPISLQTRLLRVLQEKEVLPLGSSELIPVDVRVIAATNKELERCVAEGRLREDLYYRLNILHMHLPPLRLRTEDIAEIFRHQLRETLRRIGCTKDEMPLLDMVLPRLLAYSWPGNVREMENIVERLAVFYAEFDASELNDIGHFHNIMPEIPGSLAQQVDTSPTQVSLQAFQDTSEMTRIRQTIKDCDGSLSKASQRLGISRTTLWRRLSKRKEQLSSVGSNT